MVELHEMLAVPEPVTLVGVIDPHVRPRGTLSLRLTAPANPFTAATVTAEVGEKPASTGAGEDAEMVKFWKRNVAVVV